ncbi:hypothetical protein K474DRAFT_1428027 [Panus rudis PR-1116 ss-1]|nr:hypothetical protein K474DRAFT_1428027 [Panus rudis PR-1116 ss-1]
MAARPKLGKGRIRERRFCSLAVAVVPGLVSTCYGRQHKLYCLDLAAKALQGNQLFNEYLLSLRIVSIILHESRQPCMHKVTLRTSSVCMHSFIQNGLWMSREKNGGASLTVYRKADPGIL